MSSKHGGKQHPGISAGRGQSIIIPHIYPPFSVLIHLASPFLNIRLRNPLKCEGRASGVCLRTTIKRVSGRFPGLRAGDDELSNTGRLAQYAGKGSRSSPNPPSIPSPCDFPHPSSPPVLLVLSCFVLSSQRFMPAPSFSPTFQAKYISSLSNT